MTIPKIKALIKIGKDAIVFLFFCCVFFSLGKGTNVFSARLWADEPKPIVIKEMEESIEQRMTRTISLDVRDMNVIDVIKFLALKGEFNVVISPTVAGRVTVFLNNVNIRDVMDITAVANSIAYRIENNIVSIMTAGEYESLYGKKFSDKTEVDIIRLKYSKPSYVLSALDSIKSTVGKIIIDEDAGTVVIIDTPEATTRMKAAIAEIEQPLETLIYPLQYSQAELVAQQLRTRIDAKSVGSIGSDERSNRIIVRAYPQRIKEIEKIIKELDSPTKEVLVEARVLQVVFKPEYDVGIDWKLDFKDSDDAEIKKLKFEDFNLGVADKTISGSDNLYKNALNIALGDINKDHFIFDLKALKQVSDTKILSNPQILVTNNEEAKIHIGDTVPYIISTTSGTGDNAITSEDVRFVDVGLKLNVTPSINDDGYITMRLKPEISTVVGKVDSKGGGIPQVNKTEVETTVMIKDGNTIIMGGLKRDDKSHVDRGIPILKDLPYLGPVFGRKKDAISSTEIVIFITPEIIKGKEDYKKFEGGIKPFKDYSAAKTN